MDSALIQVQIRSLELQLDVLRAALRTMSPEPPMLSGAALYGMFKGLSDTPEEVIREAEIRPDRNL